MLKKSLIAAATSIGLLLVAATQATAAPASASCAGQFFSSHAGDVRKGERENRVGGFISPTARELGRDFGAAISGTRHLDRANCGL